MLKHLLIKNYALIRELEMQPSARLNIITGETGAGKSIMLGAVGLLLGQRADTKVLFDEEQKCIIEGTFDLSSYKLKPLFDEEDLDYEELTLIRREISPAGKSRAFVNDTPVTLQILKRLGGYLMDVHSQHDTLQLGSHSFQLKVVDAFAGTAGQLSGYKQAFNAFKKSKADYLRLEEEAGKLREEADYHRFLLDELTEAKLQDENETDELEEKLKKLEHAEEIKQVLYASAEALTSGDEAVTGHLHTILTNLRKIGKWSPAYAELASRLESCIIELEDVGSEASAEEEQILFDPELAAEVQERLDMLFKLQQKHRVGSAGELIAIRDRLEEEAGRHDRLDDDLSAAKDEMERCSAEMYSLAEKLSESRSQVFDRISTEVQALLKELGMPDALLVVESKQTEPTASGTDEIHFRFSANKGVKPEDLEKVASGGEFSRLMFCIKHIIADKTALPTIIFDEIDTGISGEVALKMVRMMQVMAKSHQVVSISHLPQVAAKGDAHYHVYKDSSQSRTVSRIKKLSEQERVEEIARMIGGDTPTPAAYTSAKELITG